jgi:hypothetical protein
MPPRVPKAEFLIPGRFSFISPYAYALVMAAYGF